MSVLPKRYKTNYLLRSDTLDYEERTDLTEVIKASDFDKWLQEYLIPKIHDYQNLEIIDELKKHEEKT